MNRQQEKITALYCRIDSGKQNELDAQYGQIQSLLDYARQHGLPNPHFFCDWGYSGTTADRPEYCRMLQAVTSGHVANLVVAKLDRLIRDSGKGILLLNNQAISLANAIEVAYQERGRM